MVTFAGSEVPKSPFEVNVGPYMETDIRVYGPGLVGGVVAYPALFTVETNGKTGDLGIKTTHYKTHRSLLKCAGYLLCLRIALMLLRIWFL